MAIKKSSSGWLADLQPGGRGGRRLRKTFPTKAEALRWEAWVKTKLLKELDWAPARRDARRLSDLVKLWQELHGVSLRAPDTFARLLHLVEALGDPAADRFHAGMFTEYRARRLAEGITANALNREHAYLRAVFNELHRLGHWVGVNPLASVRQLRVCERELSFLSVDEIGQLLAALEKSSGRDALLVSKICLATGARWGEAEGLHISQVRDGHLHFSGTKSGKNRSVPVSDALLADLRAHHGAHWGGDGDRVFVSCYDAFRCAVERSGVVLPKGQLSHVLRHTFASHFMMNGGNILALQKILGHASLTMTMRYAHLAPDHFQEVKTLNPLARLTVG